MALIPCFRDASGLIRNGPSATILDRGAFRLIGLVTSEEILTELEAVLSLTHLAEKLRARGQTPAEVMRTYRAVATVSEPIAQPSESACPP